ncbi:MAG: hypothetical protein JXQ27_06005 [Acidobacteria bacterium]|nr:hypothetical protein [Acidobacteriota bacterium]
MAVFLPSLLHALVYALIINGYLLLLMMSVSPRIWGLQDYPERIKQKVPPKTRREKMGSVLLGIPFLALTLGLPFVFVQLILAGGAEPIAFGVVWLHVYGLFFLTSLVDWCLLDWLIIVRLTPRFVMIPGTEKADYRDFSHHFRAHLCGLVIMIPLSALLAWLAG